MTFVDTRTAASQRPGRGRKPLRTAAVAVAVVAALLLITLGIALGRASVAPRPLDNGGTAPPSHGFIGPRATVDGVGVGWERSADGAVAAATAYLVGINGRSYVADAEKRRRILTAIAVPDRREALAGRAGAIVRPQAPGDPFAAAFAAKQTSAWRLVPLGYRLESYDEHATVVSVWAVQVTAGVGSANVPATARWSTTTLPLRWAENDWKLDLAAARGAPGPSPGAAPGAQSSDLDVIAVDGSFAEYAHAAR
jgi:hypothetical protein